MEASASRQGVREQMIAVTQQATAIAAGEAEQIRIGAFLRTQLQLGVVAIGTCRNMQLAGSVVD